MHGLDWNVQCILDYWNEGQLYSSPVCIPLFQSTEYGFLIPGIG